MTSKEIINNHIDSLKEQAQIEKEQKTGDEVYCEIEIEQYNQVLRDLKELEKYRKVMGEPILDIMKKLNLLYVLKENIKLIDYCIYNDKIVIYLPVYYRDALKEWLDGKNNL